MAVEGQTSKNEDLRMAYQQVCSSHNAIADFRAKLLGFLSNTRFITQEFKGELSL
jgi:hypothetical protein